jgi:hypothetical protein
MKGKRKEEGRTTDTIFAVWCSMCKQTGLDVVRNCGA